MRALPLLIALGVVVYALIDCLQTPSGEVRSGSKPLWLAGVVLVPVAGAIGWLVLGRPRSGRRPAPRRPLAPDDDPDFLRGLRADEPPPPPSPSGEEEPGDPRRS